MADDHGWLEYQRLVLAKLESLEKGLNCLQTRVEQLTTDLAVMKAKSTLWGVVAGAISGGVPATAIFIMWMASR
jgi:hypothetical protein